MWYIMSQIWIWLLIAFIVGLVVGWRSSLLRTQS